MTDQPQPSDFLTVKEVATIFRLSQSAVYKAARLGKLKAIRPLGSNGRMLFRREDVIGDK